MCFYDLSRKKSRTFDNKFQFEFKITSFVTKNSFSTKICIQNQTEKFSNPNSYRRDKIDKKMSLDNLYEVLYMCFFII